jgi:molybdopterin-guanine dinucleotide biosynthesis protein A
MLSISIQAGGQSRRMGTDKALVQLGGIPLIEHVLKRVEGLADEILITSNHTEGLTYLGVPMVQDPIPGAGALAGLETALNAARGEHVLVLACDMPFVSRELIRYMIELAPRADVVVPIHAGYFEPLHAIYSKECLPRIESSLQDGQTRVISFYDEVRVQVIDENKIVTFDPQGMSFFNINTPEDLAFAESYISRQYRGESS